MILRTKFGRSRALVALAGLLAWQGLARAEPVISEFMASNASILADDDGAFSDWIEIFNPDATSLDLAGWYLTDSAGNKTKWKFPAVVVPANGYLVVFASNKNRTDPLRPLHTNFALSSEGEYLGLIRPDGVTVVSEFAPPFPPQHEDISYGLAASNGGTPVLAFLSIPTPGAPNSARVLPQRVRFSRSSGLFTSAFELSLSGAEPDQEIRYVLLAPSWDGATVRQPTTSDPKYEGPIPITSTVIVSAAVFSSDGTVRGATYSMHYLELSPELETFSSRLPIVVLDNHGLGALEKDGIDHPAMLYSFNPNGQVPTFGGDATLTSHATMTVRGNFTSLFPKKGFNLTLRDERGSERPLPLGATSASDWALVSPWSSDLSYIRNAFVYALSNQMGRWAPRTRFVEVFLNDSGDGLDPGDYHGIGVITDRMKIGRERINIAPLSSSDNTAPAITGGYVLKIDPVPDPKHFSFVTDRGFPELADTAIIVDTPSREKITPAQADYIRDYVQQMENALYADQAVGYASRTYPNFIDVPSWVDHHLLELFVGNVDALYRSDYFYKDRGGKLVSGPAWDFDGSMGHGDFRNESWDTWETAGGIDLWNFGWWGLLSHDPEFMQAWIDRWQTLRRREYADQNLKNLADALAAQIGPEAAARDLERWPDNESRFPNGYLGEVAHLKDWITKRAGWIDSQFLATPQVTLSGASLRIVPVSGAQLIYTLDGSDPRSLGGGVAPNARISTTAIDVPANANVHARSYRADLAEVFPGSPWSSAVGGDKTTPLTPRSRLANFSSRGFVGSGETALVVGLGVTDTTSKRYLVRAIGPGLAPFGVTNPVPDPEITLFSSTRVELFRNLGWQSGGQGELIAQLSKALGAFAFAADSKDSAVVAALPAGAYNIEVTSAGNQSGAGLVEFYPLEQEGRTSNFSTRTFIRSGSQNYVSGFVISGAAHKRMLFRAVGSTLAALGVGNAVSNPILSVYSGPTLIASNTQWGSADDASAIEKAGKMIGAFPLEPGSTDAALLLTLAPGAYTAEIKAADGTEGVTLFEIYDIP